MCATTGDTDHTGTIAAMAATTTLPTELHLPEGWNTDAPAGERYVVVTGSWSYGLNHADSDVDLRGFYTCAPRTLLGLGGPPDSWDRTDPDVALHEAGKYCSLALAGNPTVLETLGSDLVVETNDFADALRANLDAFLSDRVRRAYLGYARSQLNRFHRRDSDTTDPRSAKNVRHLFRLLQQLEVLLHTGELRVRVTDPTVVRSYEQLPADEMLELAEAEFARLDATPSVLPPEPDTHRVNELLCDYRVRQLHQGHP